MDIIESRSFSTDEQAIKHFELVRSRLLDINNWHRVCKSSCKFYLVDEQDLTIKSVPVVGDFIKIDIPGPATKSGRGFDWVRVEAITDGSNSAGEIIAITVRPHQNPEEEQKNIAHFFTEDSTSTFIITRLNNYITTEMHGRNETQNVHTSVFKDNMRNRMVALSALLGLSYPQWKCLVKGLIK